MSDQTLPASGQPSPVQPDLLRADLERWRLVLGEAGEALGECMSDEAMAQDAALDWLYSHDGEAASRGVRPTTRAGGPGGSVVAAVDWLGQVHRLFPQETVERLEREAIERFGITDIVTNPDVLRRVTPNQTLLKAVLHTKHLMDPQVLALARTLVARVVDDLVKKMATEVRRSFFGTRSPRRSVVPRAADFDIRRTVRANLGRYDPATGRLTIETPYFTSRTRRHVERWQVILLVDQSGSMTDSVIHSAVTAACLWGLPGLKTHLVAFDTEVVDLTSDVEDPVELLMKVQLGGGTDIARAVRYAATLVENPRRTIVALITDFYEGGDEHDLVQQVSGLVNGGLLVLGLAALDADANPAYDRATAQRLANVGAHVGAMTPGELA
ncbi:MAG: VWA domain-containing protein, partial [Micrococcales bacterium]|nr:VWA domain-containing protein [Micrococcales bacterium]